MTTPATYVWQPSTAEIAARAGIEPSEVVRADQNTSPFTPPWAAEVAATATADVNEYPAAAYRELREAIAAHHGAEPEMVVPSAGADEAIVLAARAWLGAGTIAAAEAPTYSLHRIASLQAGARFVEVPRGDDLAFPAAALAEVAGGADLTWLCVPSNPVGDRPPDDEIDRVLDTAAGVVVLDAAYAEFADDRWGPAVAARDDLVVLGTMSKAFGLAGARVGYAIAPAPLAGVLDRLRPPGSISTASAALAVRAFGESGWMEEHLVAVEGLLVDLAAGLASLGLDPLPSQANFVLCEIGDEAREVADRLMNRGVVVRAFGSDHPLGRFLRFTVRLPDQQKRMLEALRKELR